MCISENAEKQKGTLEQVDERWVGKISWNFEISGSSQFEGWSHRLRRIKKYQLKTFVRQQNSADHF